MHSDPTLTDVGIMTFNIHEAMEQARSVALVEQGAEAELKPRINGFRASTDEVRRWWSTQDPLLETHHLIVDASLSLIDHDPTYYENTRLHSASQIITIAKGAACVLSEALIGMDPLSMSHKFGLREADNSRIDYNAVLTFLRSILTIKTELGSEIGFSVQQIRDISLAQEMMESATISMTQALKSGGFIIGNKSEEQTEHIMSTQSTMTNEMGFLLNGLTNLQETDAVGSGPEEGIIGFDEMRMLGLQMAVHFTSHTESTSDIERYKGSNIAELVDYEARKLQLKSLIVTMQEYFDNPDSTMHERIRQPHIKGPLHEASWFLDTAMLKHAYPTRYADLAVWLASNSANRPTIGRPEWNRAYDYTIRKGDDMHFFQLKSSKQEGKSHCKTYHPAIVVLEEENFRELQIKRLRAKLAVYLRLIDNDFPLDESETMLNKYVMPTARYAMDSCRADIPSRQAQIKRLLADHYLPGFLQNLTTKPMNRAERRAAERAKRKSGKHDSKRPRR